MQPLVPHAVMSPDLLHTLALGPAVYMAEIVFAVVGA
jgi:hypothetical protein